MINRADFDLECYPNPHSIALDADMPYMSFVGTLGKAQWESVAVQCVLEAQEKNDWVPIQLKAGRRVAEMIAAGLLVFGGHTGHLWWARDNYYITQKALSHLPRQKIPTPIRLVGT